MSVGVLIRSVWDMGRQAREKPKLPGITRNGIRLSHSCRNPWSPSPDGVPWMASIPTNRLPFLPHHRPHPSWSADGEQGGARETSKTLPPEIR